MSKFKMRLINGSRPHKGSFMDRLSYAAGPMIKLRIPYIFKGELLKNVVRIRAGWAKSHKRRMRAARRRVCGYHYSFCGTLPVPSTRKFRWDTWGG